MTYPADLQVDAGPRIANWRPIAQWVMGLPHLIIANVLQNVAEVVALVGWFAIVFTGRLPAGLAGFQTMTIRYSARATSYAGFLREQYPAFEFTMEGEDPRTDPVQVDLEPDLGERNRLTVGLRILWIIPALLYGVVLAIGWVFAMIGAFFAVIFTGVWPEGLRSFVIRVGRWFVRFYAYAMLLTDEYPPFALE